MATQPEPRGRPIPLEWWVAGAIALLALVLMVGFAVSPLYDRGLAPAPVEPVGNATVDEVVANFTRYVGQWVTVEGEVAETLGPRALRMVNRGGGELSLLVVSTRPELIDPAMSPGVPIEVSGQVQRFVLTEVERDLEVNLDDDSLAPFDGRPVLLAESVSAAGSR